MRDLRKNIYDALEVRVRVCDTTAIFYLNLVLCRRQCFSAYLRKMLVAGKNFRYIYLLTYCMKDLPFRKAAHQFNWNFR